MSNISFLFINPIVFKQEYFSKPLTLLPHNLCPQKPLHIYLIGVLALLHLKKYPALQHPNLYFFSLQENHHHIIIIIINVIILFNTEFLLYVRHWTR